MFLVEEIIQNNLIPADVVAVWENFAIALGFTFGEINVFKQSASHLARCSGVFRKNVEKVVADTLKS